MNARAQLLDLVRPYALGGEVLEGLVLRRASTELGLRLTLDRDGEDLHIEVAPLEETPRFAARSAQLAFSYRRGVIEEELARRVCARLAEAATRNEASVLEALQEDASERVREVRGDTLLEPMGDAQRFYGLSPYVGCLVGCRFCYAQSRLGPWRRLRGLQDVPWGSWVDVRVDSPEVLARELGELPAAPIKFCPIVSDPYQPLEARYGLTRRCLEVLRGWAAPVFVLTRTTLAHHDLPLMASLPQAYFGVSLPTIDDSVRAHFEPRAASVAQRLSLLAEARALGLRTFAMVQPMLAGDGVALADALAEHVDSVSLDVLRGEQGASADFDDARFEATRDAEWQASAAEELSSLLDARGVHRWTGELPGTSA